MRIDLYISVNWDILLFHISFPVCMSIMKESFVIIIVQLLVVSKTRRCVFVLLEFR